MTPDEGDKVVLLNFDQLVALEDGTLFPDGVVVQVLPKGDPPLVELHFSVRAGVPLLTRFSVVSIGDDPLTPSGIHALRVEAIAKEALRTVAMVVATRAAQVEPGYTVDPAPAGARVAAAFSRRPGPPSESQLRQTANIYRENRYDPRKRVAQMLYVSERTASRWIAEAKRRGYIEEVDDGE